MVGCGGPHLRLEHAGELSLGEVDLAGKGWDGEVVGEVVAEPGQQVTHRLGVGGLPGQQGGELRLPAGALQVDDQLTGDGGRGLVSVVVGDEREGQIDAGGDARGGPHVAVVDVDRVGLHRDCRRRWNPAAAQSAQWVVARRPWSRPAAASRNAPEQTEVTRRASAASRLIWASSSLSATAPSMPEPPATIKVSTGPVTSPIGDEANSSPQLARTGPPRVVTTWVR